MQANSSKTGLVLKSLVALFAGAVVPALVIAALAIMNYVRFRAVDLDAPSEPGAYLLYLLSRGAIVFLVAIVFTAAHAFILGLLAALLMIRFRLVRWWTCLLAGFLIGLIGMILAALVFQSGFTDGLLVGGGLGAIGGLTTWLVWYILVERGAAAPAPAIGGPVADPPASA